MKMARYPLTLVSLVLALGELAYTAPVFAQAIAVTAKPASELEIVQLYRAPAEVITLNRSEVASETEGVVLTVHANAGEAVERGQVLIKLDATDLELARKRTQAEVASTQAQIEQAKLRLKRAKNLGEGRFVSADELLARETDMSVLAAQLRRQRLELASAQREIEKSTITAPFSGVVTERYAQLGSFLRRGDSVVSLVDTQNFVLEARIPSSLVKQFDGAREANFAVEDELWPVRLKRLFPLVEEGQRIVRARLEFAASAPLIGTSGEFRWRSSDPLLPAIYLVRREEQLGVFVAGDNGTRAQFVPLPKAVEGRPSPHSLANQTLIIIDGRERLQDGANIRLVER